MRKKYLYAKMTLLGGGIKVWKFRNPWSRFRHRTRELLFMNKIVLPGIAKFWVWVLRFVTRKSQFYLMRLSCKKIGITK